MAQVWHDLLFAHWPVPPDALRPTLPGGTELDLFEGKAWLGIVPFRITGLRARGTPPLPWLSSSLELNVRTYASAGGRPGVVFFSLDASNPAAVAGARQLFHLPYWQAEMSCRAEGEVFDYSCRRAARHRAAPAEFRGTYGPTGPVYRARPGELDHWLTERYCLYTTDGDGRLLRVDIRHEPWPLQPARAHLETNTMADAIGVRLRTAPPLLHFARRLAVMASLPRRA
jgi:uncharacterized protein YqjF (DUF2071 family)